MGLFDRLLRRGKVSETVRSPLDIYVETASGPLLAITGASASLEAAGIVSTGMAAIVLGPGDDLDEHEAMHNVEPLVRSLLRAAKREEPLQLRASWMDSRWMGASNYWLALGPAGVGELAEVINEACLEILRHHYRGLLDDVVFAYRESEGGERSVFLIFDTQAGLWYPFVPVPGPDDAARDDRDFELEDQLEVKLADALPVGGIPRDSSPFPEVPF
jgi:hypothetical protein